MLSTWRLFQDYHLDHVKSAYTDDDRTEAWTKLADAVKAYSDENVERWNREIDTMLVYVGH